MIRTVLCSMLAAALVGPAADAQATKKRKKERWRIEIERERERKAEDRRVKAASRFVARVRVPADEVASRVDRLTTGLVWFRSLPAARQAARAANKPIVWVHALGEIDAYL